MDIIIRKACAADIDFVERIYNEIHTAEEEKIITVGWSRNVYPTRATAEECLAADELFVMECGGEIVAAARINRVQVDVYAQVDWKYAAADDEVMVLHTLVVPPRLSGRGFGKRFEAFYEEYALSHGCRYLRIDTNERNTAARSMYKSLGYIESGIVPCRFNGIAGVNLVCLEKKIQ